MLISGISGSVIFGPRYFRIPLITAADHARPRRCISKIDGISGFALVQLAAASAGLRDRRIQLGRVFVRVGLWAGVDLGIWDISKGGCEINSLNY